MPVQCFILNSCQVLQELQVNTPPGADAEVKSTQCCSWRLALLVLGIFGLACAAVSLGVAMESGGRSF